MPPKKVTPRGKAAAAPAAPVARKPAAKKKAPAKPKKSTNKTLYVRNIRNIEVRATLDSERRIELRPRGERGDIASLKEDENYDAKVIDNVGMIWEIIDAATAQDIMHKQSTNQQVGPTTLDYIRNERGEKYQQVEVTPVYEEQGEVVAQIQSAPDGRNTEGNQQLVRNVDAPREVAVPGSRQNPGIQIPANLPAEQVADWVARNISGGQEAPVGDQMRQALNVTVEPTQR